MHVDSHTGIKIHERQRAVSEKERAFPEECSIVDLPLIIGHRGASRDAPENTLAAFRLALEQGADGIEADFRLTRDGRIVCIHDPTTDRTAGTDVTVSESGLDELRRLDVGIRQGERWRSERIPTLEEVLALFPPGKRLLIELKSGPEIVPPLRNVLQGSEFDKGCVMLLCFSEDVINASRRLLPECKTLWLCDYRSQGVNRRGRPCHREVLETLLRCGADGLGSKDHPCLDADLAAALRSRGKECHVWTVDSLQPALRYCSLGVDSIMTNRPEWLRKQLRSAVGRGMQP